MSSFFKRVQYVINANCNDLLDRIEDPERMIKQVIYEMDENIVKVKNEIVQAIAHEKRLHHTLSQQQQQAQQWLDKAKLALKNGQEELAKEALSRRHALLTYVGELELTWKQAQHNSQQLKQQLQHLENQLQQAKQKRTALLARQHTAQAQKHMHHTLSTTQVNIDVVQQFQRMEDRVNDLEFEAEAMMELTQADSVEQQFGELSHDQAVKDELAALKDAMQIDKK